MNLYTAIAFSVFSSVTLVIPLTLLEKLFSLDNKCFKLAAYLLFSSLLLVCIYSSLTIASIIGAEKSNEWAFNYFTSFSMDFFMINPIINFIKISVYQISYKSSNKLA
jgi:hypothetical protein